MITCCLLKLRYCVGKVTHQMYWNTVCRAEYKLITVCIDTSLQHNTTQSYQFYLVCSFIIYSHNGSFCGLVSLLESYIWYSVSSNSNSLIVILTLFYRHLKGVYNFLSVTPSASQQFFVLWHQVLIPKIHMESLSEFLQVYLYAKIIRVFCGLEAKGSALFKQLLIEVAMLLLSGKVSPLRGSCLSHR